MRPTSIEIIKKFRDAGHEAYWAGGCVRDMLLGIEPKDFDIVTSAHPNQIEDLLEKTIPIGKQFGVIMAIEDGHQFEIATFRSDAGYSDGRRPDAVEFKSAREDALRRDFTINGLFYDPLADEVIDYIAGQDDLEAHLIRFIGDPETRILEDHLRLLRAVRFKNTFDFQYHPDTYNAIKKHADKIVGISSERIRDELIKMIIDKNRAKAFEDMEDLGLLQIILPEIQAMKGVAQPVEYHNGRDVFEHTMAALHSIPEGEALSLYWSTLLHDSGKPDTFELTDRIRFDGHAEVSAQHARKILKRLNFKRSFVEQVSWLCEHHMSVYNVLDMPKKTRMRWFLKPYFLELLALNKADCSGIEPLDLKRHDQVLELYRQETDELPDEIPKLVSGEDVMELLGLEPGPKVQEVLDEVFDLQLEGKLKTHQQAIEWLRNIR